MHLQNQQRPHSSLGMNLWVSTSTYLLKGSEASSSVCGTVGNLWRKHLRKMEKQEAQSSVIHTGAMLDEHRWAQDSCADQHEAVTSVQVGCPCVTTSCKQVCFLFFNRLETVSLVLYILWGNGYRISELNSSPLKKSEAGLRKKFNFEYIFIRIKSSRLSFHSNLKIVILLLSTAKLFQVS